MTNLSTPQRAVLRLEVASIVDRLLAARARAAVTIRAAREGGGPYRCGLPTPDARDVRAARLVVADAREATVDALVSLILEARP